MEFVHPRKGKFALDELVEDIGAFLASDQAAEYKVVIGTDSQTNQQGTTFVTAIIIHRVGKGASFYYRRFRNQPVRDLRYRIYRETELSLECLEQLKEKGLLQLSMDWPVEIHLDVGQRGPTRKLIQDVVGWVTAVGYTAKIKPEAYAASAVADRFTK
ncbi:ribonuclease H-like YkuK family protein [Mechercharimyces sp. CAU 1602]|uniref:ribonuclease H-like YkuK family protein n=1 Tax=Mechercharimyces sp. CAU 1602 TaxID=2973933 RepID=UPI0021621248|nr:ribonuclease H-like YkuK family protein [Mechercharimyces sp. CAU 1602]MCS1352369.1 ribonuclease H-like YkuK family protein [Mechercharimyces sp. CAU 1602]